MSTAILMEPLPRGAFVKKGRRGFVSLLDIDEFVDTVADELQNQGEKIENLFLRTVENWKVKPQFDVEIVVPRKGSKNDALVAVTTDNEIWRYLNEGTRIRWAVMSSARKRKGSVYVTKDGKRRRRKSRSARKDQENFRPMTQVRVFGNRARRGHAVLRGRKAFENRGIPPRPGIKQRAWTDEAERRRERHFQRAMTRAIDRGLTRATRAGFTRTR